MAPPALVAQAGGGLDRDHLVAAGHEPGGIAARAGADVKGQARSTRDEVGETAVHLGGRDALVALGEDGGGTVIGRHDVGDGWLSHAGDRASSAEPCHGCRCDRRVPASGRSRRLGSGAVPHPGRFGKLAVPIPRQPTSHSRPICKASAPSPAAQRRPSRRQDLHGAPPSLRQSGAAGVAAPRSAVARHEAAIAVRRSSTTAAGRTYGSGTQLP